MTSWWKKTRDTASNLTGLASGSYQLLTRRNLPSKSGTIHLNGIHNPIEIITDRYGVPHIYAQNEDDVYFAQGYIHAQERLWQMELNRRLGSGRLSEIFGALTLETDRFCRRLGMHRAAQTAAEQLLEHDRHILEMYAYGVNSFIEQNKFPVEFTLLHIQPEPWHITDTLQWGKVQGWSLCGNWESELIRARLVAKIGVERTAKLEAGYDPDHPLIVPPGVAYQGINLGLLEEYEKLRTMSGFSTMGGSNNWVVDGTMTSTGAPLLCNDPHLGQAAPSIWFECHLIAGDLDVIGASFPGSPGVVIGHNQHIAWGVTNAISDVQDLYIEKFDPENPRRCEFAGQWEEAQVIREEIQVKGQDLPVIEEVRVTRHGPIITRIPPLSQEQQTGDQSIDEIPLALRWTGLEQHHLITAILQLNHASNWTEFQTALQSWDVPPQNFVYADKQGNIGYQMAGAIPVRSQGQALLPVPGWSGEYEWTGMIPFDELPQLYNPKQHFIVTANNRVIDDHYPYYISNEWLNGYRAQRIRDLLTAGENDQLTMNDMATIQLDQFAMPATEIVPHILQIEANTPLKRAIHEILRSWDYRMTSQSIAASIYSTFLRKIERIVFYSILGDDEVLVNNYLGAGISPFNVINGYLSRDTPWLVRMLRDKDEDWFINSAVPNGPTSWDEALHRAFEASIEELSNRFGSNILSWQYGAMHKMTYTHALGSIKILESFFNRGPYQVGGDNDTVNVSSTPPTNTSTVTVVPSYRQIINLQTLTASQAIHAPGQSGHPASKHYDDFIPLWQEGKYHPMLYTRERILAESEDTLTLTP